jgi:AcrR family transcriptional regulator
MEAIAAEAQLGKGTIYYYYPSKESLLESLVASMSGEYFRGLLEGAADHTTPAEIAQGISQALLAHYKRKPELFHVIHMVLGEPSPRPHRALAQFVTAHLHWLDELEVTISGVLQRHGLPVKPFIALIGTYSHGLLFEVVAGRPPDLLLKEATTIFQVLLSPTPQKASTELKDQKHIEEG